MDWARYAGQLRPWTARDAEVLQTILREELESLARATDREARRALGLCACEVCGDPTHRPDTPGTPTDGDDED
jgi:hypothetical protein